MTRITVAPNGARLQKADHPALPISISETAATAAACQAAGADALHLHIRDADGAHSLDPGLYAEAIAEVQGKAPGLDIQITTESAGQFDVAAQLCLLETFRPAAASIALREIARAPDLAKQVYETAARNGTEVQHILYDGKCFDQLETWYADRTVPAGMRSAITVLGAYHPPRAGRATALPARLERARRMGLDLTVCAFGPQEQSCLLAAAKAGCDLRIGFENNLLSPDGTPWPDNATALRSLRSALLSRHAA